MLRYSSQLDHPSSTENFWVGSLIFFGIIIGWIARYDRHNSRLDRPSSTENFWVRSLICSGKIPCHIACLPQCNPRRIAYLLRQNSTLDHAAATESFWVGLLIFFGTILGWIIRLTRYNFTLGRPPAFYNTPVGDKLGFCTAQELHCRRLCVTPVLPKVTTAVKQVRPYRGKTLTEGAFKRMLSIRPVLIPQQISKKFVKIKFPA